MEVFECERLVALSDGTVAITGKHYKSHSLKRFNMVSGKQVYNKQLRRMPNGLVEATLGGKKLLAVSYT